MTGPAGNDLIPQAIPSMIHPSAEAESPIMSRSVRRYTSALLGLWFTVFTVEPARFHACPTHTAGAAAGGDMQSLHAAHHGNASAQIATPVKSADHGSSSDRHSGHRCTCPDSGCCSAPLLLAPPATATTASAAVAPIAVDRDSDGPTVQRADHVLPFSTAPPDIRLA
jgi:hypothetical protein